MDEELKRSIEQIMRTQRSIKRGVGMNHLMLLGIWAVFLVGFFFMAWADWELTQLDW